MILLPLLEVQPNNHCQATLTSKKYSLHPSLPFPRATSLDGEYEWTKDGETNSSKANLSVSFAEGAYRHESTFNAQKVDVLFYKPSTGVYAVNKTVDRDNQVQESEYRDQDNQTYVYSKYENPFASFKAEDFEVKDASTATLKNNKENYLDAVSALTFFNVTSIDSLSLLLSGASIQGLTFEGKATKRFNGPAQSGSIKSTLRFASSFTAPYIPQSYPTHDYDTTLARAFDAVSDGTVTWTATRTVDPSSDLASSLTTQTTYLSYSKNSYLESSTPLNTTDWTDKTYKRYFLPKEENAFVRQLEYKNNTWSYSKDGYLNDGSISNSLAFVTPNREFPVQAFTYEEASKKYNIAKEELEDFASFYVPYLRDDSSIVTDIDKGSITLGADNKISNFSFESSTHKVSYSIDVEYKLTLPFDESTIAQTQDQAQTTSQLDGTFAVTYTDYQAQPDPKPTTITLIVNGTDVTWDGKNATDVTRAYDDLYQAEVIKFNVDGVAWEFYFLDIYNLQAPAARWLEVSSVEKTA